MRFIFHYRLHFNVLQDNDKKKKIKIQESNVKYLTSQNMAPKPKQKCDKFTQVIE